MDRNDKAEQAARHDAGDPQPWAERNQRWLAGRFAWWRERLASRPAGEDTALQAAAAAAGAGSGAWPEPTAGFTPAVDRVAASFGLSVFERELLVLAAGVEIDAALRHAVAQAQGLPDAQRVRLDFPLALSLLPQPHWDALSPLGPLRQWWLLHFDTTPGIGHAALRIDERVLYHLTGVAAFDDQLTGLATLHHQAAPAVVTAQAAPLRKLAAALAGPAGHAVVLAATAPQRADACELATAAWAALGLRCLRIDATALPADPREVTVLAQRLQREAALSDAGLCLVLDAAGAASAAALRLSAALRGPLLIVGLPSAADLAALEPRRWLRFSLAAPAAAALGPCPPTLRAAALQAAQQFKVDAPAMAQAVAQTLAEASNAAGDEDAPAALWNALREAARGGLDGLAQRIDAPTSFSDLVLPAHALAQLEAMASQLTWRHRVHEDWGFAAQGSRGLGIAALFAGDSGTGKTMAAEAIANAARLDLYRVDLASTVSKYIGETEKNLARLFDAAQASGAVLLFDEADALFGKRSEVKDSHDRYANIEVAYLLQRIESYRGLVVLTTNLKSALDPAFLRRIRFVVQFPYPDEAGRAQIWQRQFPTEAPLGAIDVPALARLQLAGGHIRSVVLNAAFHAAARGGPIEQRDLLDAARAEFSKLERSFVEPRGERA